MAAYTTIAGRGHFLPQRCKSENLTLRSRVLDTLGYIMSLLLCLHPFLADRLFYNDQNWDTQRWRFRKSIPILVAVNTKSTIRESQLVYTRFNAEPLI